MSYLIAVDPGLTGAMAVLLSNGVAVDVIDMPVVDSGKGFVSRIVDARGLAYHVRRYAPAIERIGDKAQGVRAVMERVGAMPAQGSSSTLSLGDSRGCIRGVIETLGVPLTDVPPQKWKRDLDLLVPRQKKGTPKSEKDRLKREAKARARALAIKLFPNMADRLLREKDHGRAEALLIGYWALGEKR